MLLLQLFVCRRRGLILKCLAAFFIKRNVCVMKRAARIRRRAAWFHGSWLARVCIFVRVGLGSGVWRRRVERRFAALAFVHVRASNAGVRLFTLMRIADE